MSSDIADKRTEDKAWFAEYEKKFESMDEKISDIVAKNYGGEDVDLKYGWVVVNGKKSEPRKLAHLIYYGNEIGYFDYSPDSGITVCLDERFLDDFKSMEDDLGW